MVSLTGLVNAWAQQTPGRTTTPQTAEITLDSTTVKQDSIKGDIVTTIKYTAKDSIVLNVQNKLVNMYNDANIEYGTMSLKAHTTQLDYKTNLVTAIGTKDSTGKALGTPVFKDDAEAYEAEQITYNIKSKKGKIRNVVTRQGEGFLHAEVIKKTQGDALYGVHSKYTTCDLPHPHFYINASKIKAIPGKKIFSGPFNLVFGDIPTPLGFLFGYFPTPKKRSSGLLIPTFGEARQRGFYLRQGGYYFVLNENIDMRLTGDIYSLGSYGLQLQSMYLKRYKYRGNISMSFSANKNPVTAANEATLGPGNINREPKSFWITASHTPTTLRPGGKWSASVNAGTQFYNRQNRYDNPALALNNTFSSSVQYQFAKPTSPLTFTASALHNMNTQTGVHNFTLPDASFTVNRQTPLRWFKKTGTGTWFDDIAISYSGNVRNLISTQLDRSTLSGVSNLVGGTPATTVLKLNGKNFRRILANADYGIQHSIPISMNSIRVFKYFQLSPGLSYNETWFFKKFDYNYIRDLNAVQIDTTKGFYRAYTYSASTSMSTRIYGTYIIKGKKIEAIRHLMTPNISYSYNPDFSKKYTRAIQVGRPDIENNIPIQYLPIYRNLYGVPTSFMQSNLNFSLTNNVEMKVKSKSDTASTFEKVSLIDNLGLTSGYNFAADSFQLQNVNVQFRTLLFKKLNVFSNAVFDPYEVSKSGRRVNRYSFNNGKLARLVNANLNLGMELNPEALKKGSQNTDQAPRTNRPSLETNQNLVAEYVDFKIPWTLSFTFTASYFDNPASQTKEQISKSLGIDGSVNLTEKWKITYSSGYDFQYKKMTYTSLNIYRDLHCWEMSISWVPFGEFQSYSININARSSILRDLKLSRNRGINWR
ncbi:putative LPS assembly protein LptD [Adhaeribacter radiodurans]|uniref:LPS-assembly protein LptD n=1 Tax=Adhaeribacter radiodurans TaxID=2745197 RepID=A0A7L7L204_9BACT|nr:putative LPS assembly protein LptD [Adhaeribacter radiodurans]QMU26814.1 LPS-assembly protein LptD [Adhaeribacter radiodurans]